MLNGQGDTDNETPEIVFSGKLCADNHARRMKNALFVSPVVAALTLRNSAPLLFRSYPPEKVHFGIDFCDYKTCMFGEPPLASYRSFHFHTLIDF